MPAVDLFSSIFIDWPSARDSTFVTVEMLGGPTATLALFMPLDMGMRVGTALGGCPSWKAGEKGNEYAQAVGGGGIYRST